MIYSKPGGEPSGKRMHTWLYGGVGNGRESLAAVPDGFDAEETASIADRYCLFCSKMQLKPHPSVQIFLRLRLATLKPVERLLPAENRVPFEDRDLYAFCDFIMREAANTVFDHWTSINLDLCHTTPAGCQMLARVLMMPGCHVHTVNVGQQKIGTEGSIALVQAVRENRSISRVRLRLSFIGDRGAEEFVSLINDKERSSEISEIDLSNNMLSFTACAQLLVRPPTQPLGCRVLPPPVIRP